MEGLDEPLEGLDEPGKGPGGSPEGLGEPLEGLDEPLFPEESPKGDEEVSASPSPSFLNAHTHSTQLTACFHTCFHKTEIPAKTRVGDSYITV